MFEDTLYNNSIVWICKYALHTYLWVQQNCHVRLSMFFPADTLKGKLETVMSLVEPGCHPGYTERCWNNYYVQLTSNNDHLRLSFALRYIDIPRDSGQRRKQCGPRPTSGRRWHKPKYCCGVGLQKLLEECLFGERAREVRAHHFNRGASSYFARD